jgi:signal transduction histidine kinase
MKPINPLPSKAVSWFKKNSEGKQLTQWISYIMCFTVLLVLIIEYPAGKYDWRFFGSVLTLGALLIINILWFQSHNQTVSIRRKNLYHAGFFIVTNLLVLATFALSGPTEAVFLIFMQAAQFGSVYGVWPFGTIFGLVYLGITMAVFKSYGLDDRNLIQAGSQLFAGMVFVLIFVQLEANASRQARQVEGLLKDLQAANAELKAAQQKEKELAIAEERMRMARDIHDGLGHHLTVLSIQLQAADKLVERNPAAAAEAIRTSRVEAQAALDEVRRSVGMMRQPPEESQPLEIMLANLVNDFREHTGLQATFQREGSAVELSTFARQTLFRTVQESLTNIQKHGQGVKHILAKLEYTPEIVHLLVSNDGETSESTSTDPIGYGLKGLKERVDQLRGDLCCGSEAAGGFKVDVRLPLNEVVDDKSAAG